MFYNLLSVDSFLYSTIFSLCVFLKIARTRKRRICINFRERILKEKNYSLEPDLNQRPMDNCHINNYSPPLYQLSYRGWQRVQANNCYSKQVLCDLNKSVTRISFYPALTSQGVQLRWQSARLACERYGDRYPAPPTNFFAEKSLD